MYDTKWVPADRGIFPAYGPEGDPAVTMSSVTIQCTICDAEAPDANGPCVRCGGPIGVTVQVTGLRLEITAGRPAMVNDQPRGPDTRTIDYSSSQGARSTATLAGGRVGLSVAGPVDIGKRGERRVIDAVLATLREARLSATEVPGRDEQGEDHVLVINSERVVLQIVSTPGDAEFWREVAKGAGTSDVALSRAVGWIEDALHEKAKYDEGLKHSMLLAIDVAHAGVLASEGCISAYMERYGDPVARHGFAAVWLVGPAAYISARLGSSRW